MPGFLTGVPEQNPRPMYHPKPKPTKGKPMLTRTRVNGREIICTNVREVVTTYADAPEPKQNAYLQEDTVYRKAHGGRSWYGDVKGQADIDAAVSSGWAKGASRVESLAEELRASAPPAVDVRRRRRRSDDGDTLDVDRAMRGEWDSAWESFRRAESTGTPAIELAFNWAMSASVTDEQLFWNGAVACALADILEGSGYRVGLTAIQGLMHGREHAANIIRIKDVGEVVNMSDLAAMTAHAGVYRTYGFKMITQQDAKVAPSLGIPEYEDASLRADIAESGYLASNTVWLDSVRDRASAIRVVAHVLASLSE